MSFDDTFKEMFNDRAIILEKIHRRIHSQLLSRQP